MAAHRGHDERLGAKVAQAIERRSHNRGQIGDAPTASRDRDPVPSANASSEARLSPLPPHFAGDVGNQGLWGDLANQGHRWKVHWILTLDFSFGGNSSRFANLFCLPGLTTVPR
jgi:hypothetical protein